MASVWLCQAAAGATAFVLTDALLPSCEWRGIDLAATFLNVSGSALAGLAKGRRREDDTAEIQTAVSIFVGGFLSVWTSFTFTMEHAAHLSVVKSLWVGVSYLLGSVLLGMAVYVVANRCGRRWRVSRKAVDLAKWGPLPLVKGMERVALLGAVAAVAWGSWMAGQKPNKLGWGIAMAIVGGVLGNWFCDLNGGSNGRIKWGDWRCNTLAFVGAVSATRYATSLEPGEREAVLESAFFVALVGQGFGTISGFSDLAVDTGDLALTGDYGAAAANIALNVATAGVALLARMKAEKVLLEKAYAA